GQQNQFRNVAFDRRHVPGRDAVSSTNRRKHQRIVQYRTADRASRRHHPSVRAESRSDCLRLIRRCVESWFEFLIESEPEIDQHRIIKLPVSKNNVTGFDISMQNIALMTVS